MREDDWIRFDPICAPARHVKGFVGKKARVELVERDALYVVPEGGQPVWITRGQVMEKLEGA